MLQQHCLASAGRTNDASDESSWNVEVDPIENHLVAKALPQIVDYDHAFGTVHRIVAGGRGSVLFGGFHQSASILKENRGQKVVPGQNQNAREHYRFGGGA